MTHPHTLHATNALWSLRSALRFLAAYREALLVQRPQLGPVATRPRSLAQLQQHDALLRAERAERAAGSLRGLKPSAGSAAPVAPGLLDLEREVEEALAAAVDLLAHVHRRHPLLAVGPEWHRVLRVVFGVRRDPRWTYVSAGLAGCSPGVAWQIAELLSEVDHRVRGVCALRPDHWALPLSPPCPGCGQRRLRVVTSAPDSARWTVVCTYQGGCLCSGDGCRCGMSVQVKGAPHVWDASADLVGRAWPENRAA